MLASLPCIVPSCVTLDSHSLNSLSGNRIHGERSFAERRATPCCGFWDWSGKKYRAKQTLDRHVLGSGLATAQIAFVDFNLEAEKD